MPASKLGDLFVDVIARDKKLNSKLLSIRGTLTKFAGSAAAILSGISVGFVGVTRWCSEILQNQPRRS